ncbi:hypothetical protein [Rubeoparvulum massiliense]|uniref:hypothetical protein n=1 Tax=Rubeoparvulum massiliense TaxID=1631346 RepID=UPI00065E06E4|nr:hypothetical protein [Rubeoparvulum massiliense]
MNDLSTPRWIQIVKDHGLPIQEDPDLVDALSRLETERQIPEELAQLIMEFYTMMEQAEHE